MRSRIASQLIGDELQGWPPLVFQGLAKEAFGSFPVSVACDQDVEDVAIMVHRSPKIMALTADRDGQLVHVPDVAETSSADIGLSPNALRRRPATLIAENWYLESAAASRTKSPETNYIAFVSR